MSLLLALAMTAVQGKLPPDATWVGADNAHLQYVGRIGHEEPDTASFYYSASSFRTRFRGRSLALRFEEDGWGPANSFGVKIDGGTEIPIRLVAKTDQTYVVAVGLPDRIHDLEVYRRQDTYGGVTKFKGLWLDKGARLENPPKRPSRRIEFYGDSVLGGTGTAAFGYEARSDGTVQFENGEQFLNNGYWSFGAITARYLRAEAHIQGIGGLALLDKTGWFGGPVENCVGLMTTWDKLNPLPGQYSDWDFKRFVPDVVVISVGQNDARGGRLSDSAWLANWRLNYLTLLSQIREKYPKAPIILTTTILMHDLGWDQALQDIAKGHNRLHGGESVRYFGFRRAGKGTPGHPRLAEEEEMAKELADYLEHLPGVWR